MCPTSERIGQVSWVASVLYRSCPTPQSGRLGFTADGLDYYISVDGLPVDYLPVDDLPGDDLSVDDLPGDYLPVDDLPVDHLSVGYLSVDDPSVQRVGGFISASVPHWPAQPLSPSSRRFARNAILVSRGGGGAGGGAVESRG